MAHRNIVGEVVIEQSEQHIDGEGQQQQMEVQVRVVERILSVS